ncbi:DUF5819 family protein [Aeromicrobium sp. CTD01-1L150]|uniref:DUF5819 family protein n=1 Tax=Aeromicrobium sp. CTD01-1L150 TaxID=3341830 RepID=UPI0035C15A4E
MPEEDSEQSPARRGWRSTLILALASLAVVHSVIIGLWLAPSGPVRDAAGESRLSFYVNPYFQQSWDVLDPSAQRVDEALWARAKVRVDEDTIETTEWVHVTEADLAATRYHPAPERIRSASRRLATNLNGVLFDMGSAGRKSVRTSYVTDDVSALRGVLLEEGVDAREVRRFMRLDTMTTRFASLYLQAVEDKRVVQVQYRVGRRTVPPRAERDEVRTTDRDFDIFHVGWRPVERGSEQAQAAFDDYVRGS